MNSIENIETFCNLIKNSNMTDSNYEMFAEAYYSIHNNNEESFTNNLTSISSEVSVMINATNLSNLATLCHKFSNKTFQSSFNFVRYNLIKIFYLPICLFGLFGNTLSIYVMKNKYRSAKKTKNKHHNFSFTLAMLCGADLAIILLGCFREYLEEIYAFNLRSHSIYTCKFFFFSCYLFSAFSVYLYTFIAFERWHAVKNPIEYKQKNGRKNQKRIILIFASCSLISLPFLLGSTLLETIVPKDSTIEFKAKCELSHSWYVNLTILDFLFYNCVPFIFAFLFSTLTLFKLIKFHAVEKKRRNPLDEHADANYDQLIKSFEIGDMVMPKTEPNSCMSNTSQFRIIDNDKRSKNHFESTFLQIDTNLNDSIHELDAKNSGKLFLSLNAKQSSKFKMTMMLMAFPISYVFTTAPVFVFITLQLHDSFLKQESASNYETEFAFSKTIMYLNNSLNVLFFILFGKSLRKDFLNVFRFEKFFKYFSHKRSNNLQFG